MYSGLPNYSWFPLRMHGMTATADPLPEGTEALTSQISQRIIEVGLQLRRLAVLKTELFRRLDFISPSAHALQLLCLTRAIPFTDRPLQETLVVVCKSCKNYVFAGTGSLDSPLDLFGNGLGQKGGHPL